MCSGAPCKLQAALKHAGSTSGTVATLPRPGEKEGKDPQTAEFLVSCGCALSSPLALWVPVWPMGEVHFLLAWEQRDGPGIPRMAQSMSGTRALWVGAMESLMAGELS